MARVCAPVLAFATNGRVNYRLFFLGITSAGSSSPSASSSSLTSLRFLILVAFFAGAAPFAFFAAVGAGGAGGAGGAAAAVRQVGQYQSSEQRHELPDRTAARRTVRRRRPRRVKTADMRADFALHTLDQDRVLALVFVADGAMLGRVNDGRESVERVPCLADGEGLLRVAGGLEWVCDLGGRNGSWSRLDWSGGRSTGEAPSGIVSDRRGLRSLCCGRYAAGVRRSDDEERGVLAGCDIDTLNEHKTASKGSRGLTRPGPRRSPTAGTLSRT
jgi:hypothetical protein